MSKKTVLYKLILTITLSLNGGALGCTSLGLNKLQPDPYLPPPPRSLTPLATIFKPDTLAAIWAESTLVAESAELRDSAGKTIKKRKAFPDRYGKENVVVTAGSDESESGTTQEERMIKAREAYRNRANAIVSWSEMEHTMILNQGWGQLRTVMRSGDEVTIRASVWPATVIVVPGTARIIRLESGWISLNRISPRELSCGKTTGAGDAKNPTPNLTPIVASGTAAVRLVAFVEAAESRNKSAITATTEFRGVSRCEGSSVWRDRVADFAFDAWLGADRAAKLGGPPLLSR